MVTDRKLEKPTRNTMLRLLAIALDERKNLEYAKYQQAEAEWRENYDAAQKQVLKDMHLDIALTRFQNKWKNATGQYLSTSSEVKSDSPVGQAIAELVGDKPESPSTYNYRGHGHGGDAVSYPALEQEYAKLQRTILSMEDFTVSAAMELIDAFRTGKTTDYIIAGMKPGAI